MIIIYVVCFLAAVLESRPNVFAQTPPHQKESERGAHSSSNKYIYQVRSHLRLQEATDGVRQTIIQPIDSVLVGNVIVQRINHKGANTLLHLELNSLDLLVPDEKQQNYKSVSTPALTSAENHPFFLNINENLQIEKIYINPSEEITMRNLKKAIAGLFQYQTENVVVNELDICGLCNVTYNVISAEEIEKSKLNCTSSNLLVDDQEEALFGATKRIIDRHVKYKVNLKNKENSLVSAFAQDIVDTRLSFKQEFGLSVISSLELKLENIEKDTKSIFISSNSVDEVIEYYRLKLNTYNLHAEPEHDTSNNLKLSELIDKYKNNLKETKLGTKNSAYAFLVISHAVVSSTEQEIIDVIKDEKFQPILNQIMDILGSSQNILAYKAVLKTYDLVKIKHVDAVERYLWALSLSRKPNLLIMEDLINIFNKSPRNAHLKETLILTISALARKHSNEQREKVYGIVLKNLQKCSKSDNDCKAIYLRALKNLQHIKAIPLLLKYANKGSRVTSVVALKVLQSYPPSEWNKDVVKTAENIYFQKYKVHDSSARTIAADIIIDSKPGLELLDDLLESLLKNTSYEIRKYVLQRIQQSASINTTFDYTFRKFMNEKQLYHYDFMAQRGLSSAITYPLLSTPEMTVNVLSVNEVSKSILKRSHFSVSMDQKNHSMKAFSVELFASGLSSFIWSDDIPGEEEPEESEELIAGVELSMFEVQLRPFIFFHGHASLMGHVLAGTASDRTPIFQALRSILNYTDAIPMSNGNLIKLSIVGSSSTEVAGQVSFSIWNRNANSIIDNKVGLAVEGSINVNTFYSKNSLHLKVLSANEFVVTSDLDFYKEMLCCLQISHKDTSARYEFQRLQSIPSTQYEIRQRKSQKLNLPGRSFFLNQKNNDMCAELLTVTE